MFQQSDMAQTIFVKDIISLQDNQSKSILNLNNFYFQSRRSFKCQLETICQCKCKKEGFKCESKIDPKHREIDDGFEWGIQR